VILQCFQLSFKTNEYSLMNEFLCSRIALSAKQLAVLAVAQTMKTLLFAHAINHNTLQFAALDVSTYHIIAKTFIVQFVVDQNLNSLYDATLCSSHCLSPYFETKTSEKIKEELVALFSQYQLIYGCNRVARAFVKNLLPPDTRIKILQIEDAAGIENNPFCLCHALKSCPFQDVIRISEHFRKNEYNQLPSEVIKPSLDAPYTFVLK
jgi:hypothetical protein